MQDRLPHVNILSENETRIFDMLVIGCVVEKMN